MENNFILTVDSYKLSHWKQYPAGMTSMYSYLESRGGAYPATVFFGLQYILEKHFTGRVVTKDRMAEAEEISALHFGNEHIFNRADWQYILDTYNGRLPLKIMAVPEGSVVGTGNVLMTVETTDPRLAWLVNYAETILSQVWYPCTVATQSRAMKQLLYDSLVRSGSLDGLSFKLHDFGYRGSTSNESAGIGGAAHLVNFMGTDTLAAIRMLRKYYKATMAGFSIPAAEHSTIMSWGRDGEKEAFENMLTQFPDGLVAVVSDTYDVWHAVRETWGTELRDRILGRDGTLVIRPDSGDPRHTIPALLDDLGRAFGYTKNEKGYAVLPPQVRLIQGDGIDIQMLRDVLQTVMLHGWSTDNLAFGSGGGLLQKVNRDTCRFAFKASQVVVDGETRNIRKAPIDAPEKASKAGRLALVKDSPGVYFTVPASTVNARTNQLHTVFQNGHMVGLQCFEEIRQRAVLTGTSPVKTGEVELD